VAYKLYNPMQRISSNNNNNNNNNNNLSTVLTMLGPTFLSTLGCHGGSPWISRKILKIPLNGDGILCS